MATLTYKKLPAKDRFVREAIWPEYARLIEKFYLSGHNAAEVDDTCPKSALYQRLVNGLKHSDQEIRENVRVCRRKKGREVWLALR